MGVNSDGDTAHPPFALTKPTHTIALFRPGNWDENTGSPDRAKHRFWCTFKCVSVYLNNIYFSTVSANPVKYMGLAKIAVFIVKRYFGPMNGNVNQKGYGYVLTLSYRQMHHRASCSRNAS